MDNGSNNNPRFLPIALALVGIVFSVGYFYLVTTSPVVELLTPQLSEEEISARAESAFRKLPIDHTLFQQRLTVYIDEELMTYAQYYKNRYGRYPDLTPGSLNFRWAMDSANMDDGHAVSTYYQTRYDFFGNHVGFSDNTGSTPTGEPGENFSEDDALFEAKYFLGEYGIETGALTVAERRMAKKNNRLQYNFIFKNPSQTYPGLVDQYEVGLTGNWITTYKQNRVVDYNALKWIHPHWSSPELFSMLFVSWTSIFLALGVCFIRKNRRDELEYKRALWPAVFLGACVAVAFISQVLLYRATVELVLMGAVVVGLTIGLAFLVLPVVESQGRDIWPEKLAVTDLLLQGRVFFRDTGTAILKSFFLIGITLLYYGILIRMSGTVKPLYIFFNSESINSFHSLLGALPLLGGKLVFYFFIVVALLNFWPGFLKRTFRNKLILYLLPAVTIAMAGMQYQFFKPWYLSLLLNLPAALFWVYIVYKNEQLTVTLSAIGTMFLLDSALMFKVLDTIPQLSVTIFISLGVLFFLLGCFLVFRNKTARDYENYVPGYVTRVAERERLTKELEIARSVQMRFLPQNVPHFPNLEIVSLCQPAMEVGGDYYDFIRIDERHMSILIGDVSGKGVSAAFYMTMVKGIIKTLAKRNKQPAQLLTEANDIFRENAPRDVFITVIFGIFDLEERRLTVASAGHNPLVVLKQNRNKAELVNPKGIGLGLKSGEGFKELIAEENIEINDGDVFVFYTDGVSESMNHKSEVFGEERLCRVIETSAHLPSRGIQNSIIEAVERFSGKTPQHDDFTMVVVKVKESV